MDKVLNQEEIDAIVQAARGAGSSVESQSSITRELTVVPWDVRRAGQIGRDQLRSISILHEDFARNLTDSLGAYLGAVFQAALVSAEHLTYREFLQPVPENTYVASCRLEPVGVNALMQIDLPVAFSLVDLLLGGEGQNAVLERGITEIEEQILDSVVRIICRELQRAWQALALEFIFDQRQQTTQVRRLMPADEKVLSLCFEITLPAARGNFNLAVPAVVSNALLRKISDYTYQKPRGPAASDGLRRRLLDCPFEVELDVTSIMVPAERLLNLSRGELLVLPRSVDEPARLIIGKKEMFSAIIARVGRSRAAQIIEYVYQVPAAGKE